MVSSVWKEFGVKRLAELTGSTRKQPKLAGPKQISIDKWRPRCRCGCRSDDLQFTTITIIPAIPGDTRYSQPGMWCDTIRRRGFHRAH